MAQIARGVCDIAESYRDFKEFDSFSLSRVIIKTP